MELKYQAADGTLFDSSEECVKRELNISKTFQTYSWLMCETDLSDATFVIINNNQEKELFKKIYNGMFGYATYPNENGLWIKFNRNWESIGEYINRLKMIETQFNEGKAMHLIEE